MSEGCGESCAIAPLSKPPASPDNIDLINALRFNQVFLAKLNQRAEEGYPLLVLDHTEAEAQAILVQEKDGKEEAKVQYRRAYLVSATGELSTAHKAIQSDRKSLSYIAEAFIPLTNAQVQAIKDVNNGRLTGFVSAVAECPQHCTGLLG